MHDEHRNANERMRRERRRHEERNREGLDYVRAESREEDTGKSAEPLAGKRMVRRREGRRRVRQPEAVPGDDEQGEPCRALPDDPRGERGDGDTRDREDPPKIALTQKAQVSDLTA